MTLFPASSLRVSHCANDSDTASTELFESGSAAGSLSDLQYQAFDRMASFNEFKNAMSSLQDPLRLAELCFSCQENVQTGANLVYSTSTENGFHPLGVITTEPCDYPSPRDFRTEVSCYQETSIQRIPHENLDLVPAPSVCHAENSLLVSVDEKCQVSRESSFNNQMDKITHKSIENVECLRDGLASAHSKTLEIADPYCSFQSFDRDNADCLKACSRNLCESLNQGNGVGGNRDTTCNNTYNSAFESDVELAAKRLRLTPTSEELKKEPLQ